MKPSPVGEMSALTSSQPEKSTSLYHLLNWGKNPTLILLAKLILQINFSYHLQSCLISSFATVTVSLTIFKIRVSWYRYWLWLSEQSLYHALFFTSSFSLPNSSVALALYILQKILKVVTVLCCSTIPRHDKSHDPWLLLVYQALIKCREESSHRSTDLYLSRYLFICIYSHI